MFIDWDCEKLVYQCCRYLRKGINFTRTGIKFCNKLSAYNESNITDYSGDFYKKFLEKKAQVLADCQKGIIPEPCKNCMYLETKDWNLETEPKISEIEVFHWNQCNCACVYCANRDETHLKITEEKSDSGFVQLYPILKKLILEGAFVQSGADVYFNGGEPALLNEMPDIISLFLEHNYNMQILTNGILYEDIFAQALKQNSRNAVTISLDCGSKELFKKIKGADKFDDVTANIKRYIKEAEENSSSLFIKYILLEGLNDNKEEIIKWLELSKSLGVKSLHPSIEFCHSIKDDNKTKISEHICCMYGFMKEKITEYGFNLRTYDFVDLMIKNRSRR